MNELSEHVKLQREVFAIKRRLEIMDGKEERSLKRSKNQSETILALKEKISLAIGIENGKLMETAKRDSAFIHKLYRHIHLQLTVVQMVTTAIKQNNEIDEKTKNTIFFNMVRAMGEDKSWWKSRENDTLNNWILMFGTYEPTIIKPTLVE